MPYRVDWLANSPIEWWERKGNPDERMARPIPPGLPVQRSPCPILHSSIPNLSDWAGLRGPHECGFAQTRIGSGLKEATRPQSVNNVARGLVLLLPLIFIT